MADEDTAPVEKGLRNWLKGDDDDPYDPTMLKGEAEKGQAQMESAEKDLEGYRKKQEIIDKGMGRLENERKGHLETASDPKIAPGRQIWHRDQAKANEDAMRRVGEESRKNKERMSPYQDDYDRGMQLRNAAEEGQAWLSGIGSSLDRESADSKNVGLAKWEKAAYAMNTGMEFFNQAVPQMFRLATGILTGDSMMSVPSAIVGAATDNVVDAAIRAMQTPGGVMTGLKEDADRKRVADVDGERRYAMARLRAAKGVQDGMQDLEQCLTDLNSVDRRNNRNGGPGDYAFSTDAMDMNQLGEFYGDVCGKLDNVEQELAKAMASGNQGAIDRCLARKSVLLAALNGIDSRVKGLSTDAKYETKEMAAVYRYNAMEIKMAAMKRKAEKAAEEQELDDLRTRLPVFAVATAGNGQVARRIAKTCIKKDSAGNDVFDVDLTNLDVLADLNEIFRNLNSAYTSMSDRDPMKAQVEAQRRKIRDFKDRREEEKKKLANAPAEAREQLDHDLLKDVLAEFGPSAPCIMAMMQAIDPQGGVDEMKYSTFLRMYSDREESNRMGGDLPVPRYEKDVYGLPESAHIFNRYKDRLLEMATVGKVLTGDGTMRSLTDDERQIVLKEWNKCRDVSQLRHARRMASNCDDPIEKDEILEDVRRLEERCEMGDGLDKGDLVRLARKLGIPMSATVGDDIFVTSALETMGVFTEDMADSATMYGIEFTNPTMKDIANLQIAMADTLNARKRKKNHQDTMQSICSNYVTFNNLRSAAKTAADAVGEDFINAMLDKCGCSDVKDETVRTLIALGTYKYSSYKEYRVLSKEQRDAIKAFRTTKAESILASASPSEQFSDESVAKRAINLTFDRKGALEAIERNEAWEPQKGRGRVSGLGAGPRTGEADREYDRLYMSLRQERMLTDMCRTIGLNPTSDYDRRRCMMYSENTLRNMGAIDEKALEKFVAWRNARVLENPRPWTRKYKKELEEALICDVFPMSMKEVSRMKASERAMYADTARTLMEDMMLEDIRREDEIAGMGAPEPETYRTPEYHHIPKQEIRGDAYRRQQEEMAEEAKRMAGFQSVERDEKSSPSKPATMFNPGRYRKLPATGMNVGDIVSFLRFKGDNLDEYWWTRWMRGINSPNSPMMPGIFDEGGAQKWENVNRRYDAIYGLAKLLDVRIDDRGAVSDRTMMIKNKFKPILMLTISEILGKLEMSDDPEVRKNVMKMKELYKDPENQTWDQFVSITASLVGSFDRNKGTHTQTALGNAMTAMAENDEALRICSYRLYNLDNLIQGLRYFEEDADLNRGKHKPEKIRARSTKSMMELRAFRNEYPEMYRRFMEKENRLRSLGIIPEESEKEIMDHVVPLDEFKGTRNEWRVVKRYIDTIEKRFDDIEKRIAVNPDKAYRLDISPAVYAQAYKDVLRERARSGSSLKGHVGIKEKEFDMNNVRKVKTEDELDAERNAENERRTLREAEDVAENRSLSGELARNARDIAAGYLKDVKAKYGDILSDDLYGKAMNDWIGGSGEWGNKATILRALLDKNDPRYVKKFLSDPKRVGEMILTRKNNAAVKQGRERGAKAQAERNEKLNEKILKERNLDTTGGKKQTKQKKPVENPSVNPEQDPENSKEDTENQT